MGLTFQRAMTRRAFGRASGIRLSDSDAKADWRRNQDATPPHRGLAACGRSLDRPLILSPRLPETD